LLKERAQTGSKDKLKPGRLLTATGAGRTPSAA